MINNKNKHEIQKLLSNELSCVHDNQKYNSQKANDTFNFNNKSQ